MEKVRGLGSRNAEHVRARMRRRRMILAAVTRMWPVTSLEIDHGKIDFLPARFPGEDSRSVFILADRIVRKY